MGQNNRSNVLTTGQNALSTNAEIVIAENPQRIGLAIHNTSTDIAVYVGFTSAVASTTGHKIHFVSEFVMYDYTGPVYMVAGSATPTVTYVEW